MKYELVVDASYSWQSCSSIRHGSSRDYGAKRAHGSRQFYRTDGARNQ